MAKYKEGDIVTIKSKEWYDSHKGELSSVTAEGKPSFIPQMTEYCGKLSRITKVKSNETYELEIDKGYWDWADYMFEGEPDDLYSKYKVGDKVRIKSEEGLRDRDGGVLLNEKMYEHAGKIATIINSIGYGCYCLDIDRRWYWDNSCFEDSLYLPGDKVKIKSLDWYKENKDDDGYIRAKEGCHLNHHVANELCGKVFTISEVDEDYNTKYRLKETTLVTVNDWIEGLAEEESETIDITSHLREVVEKVVMKVAADLKPLSGTLVYVSDSYHEDGPREDWTIARFEKARAKGISTKKGIWNYCIPSDRFDYDNWENTKKHIYRGENHELIKVNKDE